MSVLAAHIRAVPGLPAYALFAALLAAAGLPLYIHAPKFYVDAYGVSLAALGAVLFGLRLLDVVQDPLLGHLSERLRHRRGLAAGVAVAVLAGAMLGLFAVVPPISPLLWFAAMLTLVFSAFSFLTISFYAQGVAKAGDLGATGHLQLARWRETGALLGVCAAAVAPVLLTGAVDSPFAGFAALFAGLAVISWLAMRGEWAPSPVPPSAGFGPVVRDRVARRLLLIAFLNAAPVAVSSTLFLFFVESRLLAPDSAGPLLLLFFLSAAAAAPAWGRVAERFGTKRTLICGMVLSILAFGFAVTLGAGDVVAFGIICVLSGATLGADMTLLPAMFARRMERVAPAAAEGFGLWSFVSKSTLAFAAIVLLPALEAAGFRAGSDNDAAALWTLSLFYAAVPCGLKLLALALLAATDLEDD
ncbi:glycoside/pentoside/hexuronide:cation symporter, GPH family [Cribrihabitans marinus]|uniref:Glycoside/pentoside/hexuronide:cation symporter, GPH family n=1 Tax=Cribrihabitans marinus TaxID=1227549 RepID=A0A1H6XSF1_9RHOB|nr:MFS transporter [Cribrihabitans marinus]GGH27254.1 sugar:cation symporter [Cribrihabitans marinus]SEJ27495.1 glycoside/pentoside/hexuronide:cation symporter, GPH family [Cribrihabitans marinus]